VSLFRKRDAPFLELPSIISQSSRSMDPLPYPEPSFTLPGSPSRAPVKRNAPFPEPSSHSLSHSSLSTDPSPGSPTGPLQRHPSIGPSTSHPQKIHLSLGVPGKGAPSMFPNRIPMDKDTPSPEPLVCLFIHSCMSARVPKKEPSYIWGKT